MSIGQFLWSTASFDLTSDTLFGNPGINKRNFSFTIKTYKYGAGSKRQNNSLPGATSLSAAATAASTTNSINMMKEILILAIVACAVMADNYACHDKGKPFECFESAPDAKFCVTGNGHSAHVICSKCRKKADFCINGLTVARHPERDCGADWESTPCTAENSKVPTHY